MSLSPGKPLYFDNSLLSYYLVYYIASVGRDPVVELEVKKLLFDAAATFYCRALTRGSQNIPNSSRIANASDSFNFVEDWLIKWRHNVVMHEFCVRRGILFYVQGDDILPVKYVPDGDESVDERLKVAQDLSVYRIRYRVGKVADLKVPVDKYTLIASTPPSAMIDFPILTEQSLVPVGDADLQQCRRVFKDLWSLLLIQDMCKEAIMCIDEYSKLPTMPTELQQKVYKIAYLIKAINLVYATHSPGHLTVRNEISQLMSTLRAGGGHGSDKPGGYFEWPCIPVDHDISQESLGKIVLPTDEQVNDLRLEAVTLFSNTETQAVSKKSELLTLIDVRCSACNNGIIPLFTLNGPGKSTKETSSDSLSIMGESESDSVFGTMFDD